MKSFKQRKLVSYVLMAMLTWSGLFVQAHAGMIATGQLAQEASADLQRSELNTLFAREDVAKKLSSMGVDPAQALERVASLSNAELGALQSKMSELPAGQGALGAVLTVLLILILLDVIGATDLFPRI